MCTVTFLGMIYDLPAYPFPCRSKYPLCERKHFNEVAYRKADYHTEDRHKNELDESRHGKTYYHKLEPDNEVEVDDVHEIAVFRHCGHQPALAVYSLSKPHQKPKRETCRDKSFPDVPYQ